MESYGFFDGDTEYGQAEFNRYFNYLYRSGVSVDDSGNMELKVSVSGKALKVAAGFAVLQGFFYYNDSELTLTPTPNSNYARIDRVVVRLDISSQKISTVLKAGTAGSNPKAPDLQRDNLIYEVSLAQVKISTAGALTVTDERFNQSLCGAIRPKNLTEYNAMVAQFQQQFTDWFNAQQAKGWRNIFIQSNTPAEAVTGSIWIQG
ncbi:MAG TPA: hypothetical protein IAA00_01690 [Candidatus Blautia ornithocaccae]|nr:hypothetical protein [Candidatus Blautia ornithocaccae]